jgi:LmbE family N-acetylglucosaminyl deacetylase
MSVLVVAAHPDDETVGAGATLALLDDVTVVHLTDGAPRHPGWIPASFTGTREEYAQARFLEARQALALAGVHDVRSLGCPDLEAIHNVRELTDGVRKIIEELRPEVVLTLAYEGGHPDHDACAMIVQTLGGAIEMPLYHARGGELCVLQFADDRDGIVIHLDDEQRALKQRMYDCYATQQEVMAQFPIELERFRVAPRYDFAKPPHDGPLFYEILGMPVDGETWRRLAAHSR